MRIASAMIWRFRFGLDTLVVIVLLTGSAFALAWRWAPWRMHLERHHFKNSVEVCRYSPNGETAVLASANEAVVIDVQSGKEIARLTGEHLYQILDAEFSEDGQRVVTGGQDRRVCVWDVQSGKCVASLVGHSHEVVVAKFSADGKRVVSAGLDRSVRVWDSASGCLIACLNDLDVFPRSVRFWPDAEHILFCINGEIRSWSIGDSNGYEKACQPFDGAVRMIEIRPDAYPPGSHTGWLMPRGRCDPVIVLNGPAELLTAGTLGPDGKRVLSMCNDGKVRIWDSVSGEELGVLGLGRHRLTDADFAPDGNHLLSSSEEGRVVMWERIRPEWWWGVVFLWEFWISMLLSLVFLFSIRKDLRILYGRNIKNLSDP